MLTLYSGKTINEALVLNTQNKIKKERAQILVQEGKEQLNTFLQNNMGKYGKLLTEKGNVGHTENFIIAKIHNIEVEPGSIVLAKLETVQDGKMIATAI